MNVLTSILRACKHLQLNRDSRARLVKRLKAAVSPRPSISYFRYSVVSMPCTASPPSLSLSPCTASHPLSPYLPHAGTAVFPLAATFQGGPLRAALTALLPVMLHTHDVTPPSSAIQAHYRAGASCGVATEIEVYQPCFMIGHMQRLHTMQHGKVGMRVVMRVGSVKVKLGCVVSQRCSRPGSAMIAEATVGGMPLVNDG